jgi:DNA-binding transcriptional ArsR family regulator
MPGEQKFEIRDLRNGDWYWIDRSILHSYGQKLKASGIAVYNALASFANFKTQTCFPTQEAIAQLIGLSPRTVRRKVKLMIELGLTRVEKRGGSAIYYLLRPDRTEETVGQDKRDTSDRTPEPTNNNYLTRNNNNINVVAEQLPPLNGSLINSLIARFSEVNPNYERLFANKTQRLALERLVRKFGQPMVERLIDLLPGVFGRPYAPRITTPLKLEEKLADLLSFIKEEERKGDRVFTIKSKQ